jgi:hypothetical protein
LLRILGLLALPVIAFAVLHAFLDRLDRLVDLSMLANGDRAIVKNVAHQVDGIFRYGMAAANLALADTSSPEPQPPSAPDTAPPTATGDAQDPKFKISLMPGTRQAAEATFGRGIPVFIQALSENISISDITANRGACAVWLFAPDFNQKPTDDIRQSFYHLPPSQKLDYTYTLQIRLLDKDMPFSKVGGKWMATACPKPLTALAITANGRTATYSPSNG